MDVTIKWSGWVESLSTLADQPVWPVRFHEVKGMIDYPVTHGKTCTGNETVGAGNCSEMEGQ